MKEFLTQLQQQTARVWNALSIPQRVTMVMFAVALAAVLAFVGLWSSNPNYVPVASGLAPDEVTAASAKLRDSQIPFRYEGSRGLISVPTGKLDDARLVLAELGVPSGAGKSEGFELFDRNTFGMTEFVQKVNYVRALQGKLERQVSSLDGVERANVTLSIPEDQVFLRDQQEAKASVEVKMRRGLSLRANQVASIRHIVAAAVPKLTPQNVAVMDSEGRLLARFQTPGDDASMAGDQLENRMRMERYLTDKVEGLLDHALGPGRAAVQVAVELDFSRIERRSEKKDPNSEVLMKQTTHSKESRGVTPIAGGSLGVKANQPAGGDAGTTVASTQLQTEKNITTDFHFDTVTEVVRPEVGSIKRLSVAVMVKPRVDGAGQEQKFVTLTETELKGLSEVIKNAVGFAATRNDEVKVENSPMPQSVSEAFVAPTAAAEGMADTVERFMPAAGTVFGIAALAVVFWITMKRLSGPMPASSAEPAGAPDAGRGAGPGGRNVQVEIQSLVRQNSGQAAEMIRTLLKN
ncbi:MAG: flagellar M-ring protein FliF [Planctomycetota bacterium]|nr:flagellar M-ring protein FliF [Planctomycetota bacterium]